MVHVSGRKSFPWLAILFLLLSLSGCGGGGGGGSGGDGGGGGGSGNPLAVAGADKSVVSGDNVLMNGSASTDPQAGALGFSWTQVSGPTVTLANAGTSHASFTAPDVETGTTLIFSLTVTDPEALTGEDLITVHVEPPPSLDPVAVISPVNSAAPSRLVVLDGSASRDPQGGALTFAWTQVSGTAVTLDGAATDTATFTAPAAEGDLVFQLTVTTGELLTATVQTTVAVAAAPPAAPPSSIGLIDEALSRGEITSEQALVNKVFAVFGDSRLPPEYAGDTPDSSTAIMDEVMENFESLSPAAQGQVYPFIVPPYSENSWYAMRKLQERSARSANAILPGWKTKTKGKVKVWYEDGLEVDYGYGPVTAETVATALLDAASGRIWTELKSLMKIEPMSDLGAKLPPLKPGSGVVPGDLDQGPELDIIVSDAGKVGNCKTDTKKPSPSYITININLSPIGDEFNPGLIQTLAHEMMHAWQNSYPIYDFASNYSWLKEATAKWAEGHVYDNANSENGAAQPYFSSMHKSIDEIANEEDVRQYGVYTAFTYWTHSGITTSKDGPDDMIRQIWEKVGSNKSLEAVDLANPVPNAGMLPHDLTSFFERYWGDYLVAAWNHGPDGYFRNKDKLEAMPSPRYADTVNMSGTERRYFLDKVDPSGVIELPHLTGRYYYFIFNDDKARSVMFFEGLRSKLEEITVNSSGEGTKGYVADPLPRPGKEDPAEGATHKVMVRINGKWEDWTKDLTKAKFPMLFFCRDFKGERIEQMAIALGNSSADTDNTVGPPDGGLAPLLFVSNIGCYQWEGDINVKYTDPDGGPNQSSSTHVILANAADVPIPYAPPMPIRPWGTFIVKSASTTTTISGTTTESYQSVEDPRITSSQTCTFSGGGTFDWDEDHFGYELNLIPYATSGDRYRSGWLESAGSPGTVDYKTDCELSWTDVHRDDNGNEYVESHSDSTTSDSTITPEVWPPGPSAGVRMGVSADGAGIVGSFTSEDGNTKYDWNLQSKRQ